MLESMLEGEKDKGKQVLPGNVSHLSQQQLQGALQNTQQSRHDELAIPPHMRPHPQFQGYWPQNMNQGGSHSGMSPPSSPHHLSVQKSSPLLPTQQTSDQGYQQQFGQLHNTYPQTTLGGTAFSPSLQGLQHGSQLSSQLGSPQLGGFSHNPGLYNSHRSDQGNMLPGWITQSGLKRGMSQDQQ